MRHPCRNATDSLLPRLQHPQRGKFRRRHGSLYGSFPARNVKRISWKDLLLWVPTLFLVYVFARQGPAKFSDTSGWARAFAVWQFPVWFRILIGVAETTAALLLLSRRTASVGAAIIALVMLGGMATHIYWGQPKQITSEVLPLVLALIVLVGRRRHFAELLVRLKRRGPE